MTSDHSGQRPSIRRASSSSSSSSSAFGREEAISNLPFERLVRLLTAERQHCIATAARVTISITRRNETRPTRVATTRHVPATLHRKMSRRSSADVVLLLGRSISCASATIDRETGNARSRGASARWRGARWSNEDRNGALDGDENGSESPKGSATNRDDLILIFT